MNTITVDELATRLSGDSPPILLDVRTAGEHASVHIPGSVLHPLQRLDPETVGRALAGGTTCVICLGGQRAAKAIEKLEAAGVQELVHVEGGMKAWERAGHRVTRGRGVMSLERQVRIAAGGLALLGAILGFAVHPYWHGLSGFIGAGLVFAGITNTCGMGMLIARMPWNQRAVPATAAQAQ